MIQYILRRILVSFVTLLIISIIIFLMLRLLPGDPARVFAGELATAEEVERLRSQLGLDKPIPTQYFAFIKDLLKGDFGKSMRTNEPVIDDIKARMPATLKLAVVSIILATLIGVPAGVIAALKPYSIFDSIASIGTLVGVAMPVYWMGLMLMLTFSIHWKLFPPAGDSEGWKSIVLPSITLAAFSMALITRMTRAAMLDVLTQEYVTTARAKGLRENTIVIRHVLRNALIPVVTVVGLQFGSLLGGAILTETIFAWPGLGRLLTESLYSRDYPVIQGLVLIFAAMFIVVNLLVDILYSVIDPRIQYD